jgi:hypothetical protein
MINTAINPIKGNKTILAATDLRRFFFSFLPMVAAPYVLSKAFVREHCGPGWWKLKKIKPFVVPASNRNILLPFSGLPIGSHREPFSVCTACLVRSILLDSPLEDRVAWIGHTSEPQGGASGMNGRKAAGLNPRRPARNQTLRMELGKR